MKPYPIYKHSGQPWLGPIPEHWRTVPTFVALRERQVPNIGLREKTLLSLSYGRIIIKDIDSAFGLLPASFETYQIVEPGNIILRFTDLQNDHKSLRVGLAKNDGIITSAYLCLSVNPFVLPQYAYQQIHAIDTQKLFYSMGGGLRQSLGYNDLRRMPFLVPPAAEQAAIVAYLDRKTAAIERFITKKRQLIALLNEQKAAIINRAVTKGLNPDAPMKASGVEWLGEVPAHWEVRRLKFLGRIRYGLGQPPEEKEAGLPLIRATNVERGRIVEKDMVYVNPNDVPSGRDAFLRSGEIVVVRSGAYTADSAIIPTEYDGAVVGYDMVVTPRQINASFMAFVLLSRYVLQNQLFLQRMRAAQPHLNKEELGEANILVPPVEEQENIVSYIEAESTIISEAISRIEREIKLIQEYRTTLISDAVTGKIDVREAVEAESAAASLIT